MNSLYELSLAYAKQKQLQQNEKFKDLHDEYLALSKEVEDRKEEILDLIKAFEYLNPLRFKDGLGGINYMLNQFERQRLPYPLISLDGFSGYHFMGIAMKDARIYDNQSNPNFDCGVVIVISKRKDDTLVIDARYKRSNYNLCYADSRDDWCVNSATYKIGNMLLRALLDHLEETREQVRKYLEEQK